MTRRKTDAPSVDEGGFVAYVWLMGGVLILCMLGALSDNLYKSHLRAAIRYCEAALATARTPEDTLHMLRDTTQRYQCERYMDSRR